MGIGMFSRDRYDECSCPKPVYEAPVVVHPGNPDPANYQLVDTLTIGNFLIVEIKYPNCKNYEGRKILVYEGVTWQKLRSQKLIDPHFSANKKFISPIARFEPTDRGWRMATVFVKNWSERK